MCGIVGYVGHRRAEDFLLEGLRRLEYRGYDSAGIATLTPDREFHVAKAVGRIEALAGRLADAPLPGSTGIGHTRWATHGVPSEANAHPHFGILASGGRQPTEQPRRSNRCTAVFWSNKTDWSVLARIAIC